MWKNEGDNKRNSLDHFFLVFLDEPLTTEQITDMHPRTIRDHYYYISSLDDDGAPASDGIDQVMST